MSRFFVDASVFITLSAIGHHELMRTLTGEVVVPREVADEIVEDPAASYLEEARMEDGTTGDDGGESDGAGRTDGWLTVPTERIRDRDPAAYRNAAAHLDQDFDPDRLDGDVALLAYGLRSRVDMDGSNGEEDEDRDEDVDDVVIVTDDKPLRETCRALGIPVSGSIGVLIVAVEQDRLTAEEAKEALLAMDSVGARLSATLLRRAEVLIDNAE